MVNVKDLDSEYVSYDDLMGFYNIKQESLILKEKPLIVWSKWRNFVQSIHNVEDNSDFLQEDILVANFPSIESLQKGVIFASFHFSSYFRVLPLVLAKILTENNIKKKISILMVSSEEKNIRQRFSAYQNIFDLDVINVDEKSIGMRIIRALKNKECLFIYLDADFGEGAASKPVQTHYLWHKITVRRGIFELAQKMNAPIIPIVVSYLEDKMCLFFSDSVNSRDTDSYVQNTFQFFSKFVAVHPEEWFCWNTHHLRSDQQNYTEIRNLLPGNKFLDCVTYDGQQLVVNIESGELFTPEA